MVDGAGVGAGLASLVVLLPLAAGQAHYTTAERSTNLAGSLLFMALTLLFSLGGYTPLYPFFHKYFPLFSTLRYPVKFLFLFVFFYYIIFIYEFFNFE